MRSTCDIIHMIAKNNMYMHTSILLSGNSLSACLCICDSCLRLDPQTDIYLESIPPGEFHNHTYMATPFFVIKKPKMVLLP